MVVADQEMYVLFDCYDKVTVAEGTQFVPC